MNANKTEPEESATEELNRVFGRVEQLGVRVSLALVLVAFLLYATGWVEALIPPARLVEFLNVNADAFVRAHRMPVGWQWLGLTGFSDMLSLGSLMIMVGVVFAAYLLIVPVLLRQRDYFYLALVLAQLGLIVLAGWGGPAGGH